jgi:hypothetical protein
MTTSKGTIQGYNRIAAVDSKHQIVIAAKAIGEGQEQHSMQSHGNRIALLSINSPEHWRIFTAPVYEAVKINRCYSLIFKQT